MADAAPAGAANRLACPPMHFKDLDRGELIALIGGVLLGVSLFVHWFALGNSHATLASCKGPHTGCTGWQGLPIVRYVLLVAAAAPVILAYIILRGHALSWPRGELTAVTALTALDDHPVRGRTGQARPATRRDQPQPRLVPGPGGRDTHPHRFHLAHPGKRRGAKPPGVL